jgi:hypothetical protein
MAADQPILTTAELQAIRKRFFAVSFATWFFGKDGSVFADGGLSQADIDFIGHARKDMAKLLAEIKRLRRTKTSVK